MQESGQSTLAHASVASMIDGFLIPRCAFLVYTLQKKNCVYYVYKIQCTIYKRYVYVIESSLNGLCELNFINCGAVMVQS